MTITVELFTHPTCSGCQQALTALRKLEHAGLVALEVTSLGSPNGRRRATAAGVSVVPTVRIGTDFRVLDGPADLRALLTDHDIDITLISGGAKGSGGDRQRTG
jgi:hypothetical protein